MDKPGIGKERFQEKKRRTSDISTRLALSYPEILVPLQQRNPYELLIATILSAQCTDEQVNRVTPNLFLRYPNARRLAQASLREIEKLIHSVGFFRSKARALKRCAEQLMEEHQGEVPATMEELTGLKGVGRKTANVILGHAFGIPGVVVDTHVKRLSRRLGLARAEEPDKIEQELMALLLAGDWTAFSLRLILHGRRVCHARRPRCGVCVLNALCPSSESASA